MEKKETENEQASKSIENTVNGFVGNKLETQHNLSSLILKGILSICLYAFLLNVLSWIHYIYVDNYYAINPRAKNQPQPFMGTLLLTSFISAVTYYLYKIKTIVKNMLVENK